MALGTVKPVILILGTSDTKLDEILYLRDEVLAHGSCETKILDTSHSKTEADSAKLPDDVIAPLHEQGSALKDLPRGEYIDKAIELCLPVVKDMVSKAKIQGMVCAGGTSNSSLVAALMRKACPVGFPKLLVSTAASGDTKPYIGETDITMMYSVVDIAGLNSILKRILSNAAGAIVGMTLAYAKSLIDVSSPTGEAKKVAVSMFGVTTPCVDHIRRILTTTPHDVNDYEIYVFHATGAGGRAMERLIEEGQIDAVIDLTTTEVPDELMGGVFSAGPDRLEVAAKRGIPMVVSVGACDMVNFGSIDTVPEKYKDRNLHRHNPTVTLMRTTKDENIDIGKFIASKLKTHATNPSLIRVMLPMGGISMIDAPSQPFHDPAVDEALFNTIGDELNGTEIEVEKYPEHINDEVFAAHLCRVILELIGVNPRKYRLANMKRRKWSFDHGATVMAATRRASQVEGF